MTKHFFVMFANNNVGTSIKFILNVARNVQSQKLTYDFTRLKKTPIYLTSQFFVSERPQQFKFQLFHQLQLTQESTLIPLKPLLRWPFQLSKERLGILLTQQWLL